MLEQIFSVRSDFKKSVKSPFAQHDASATLPRPKMPPVTTGGVSDYRRPRRTSKKSRVANRAAAETDGFTVSMRHEPPLNKELIPDDAHVASGCAEIQSQVSNKMASNGSNARKKMQLKLDPLPKLQIQQRSRQ